MHIDREAFFWLIQDGKLPPPNAAETLNIKFIQISPKEGKIEVEFDAQKGFANPAGNIQGGFLAAMLDDTMGPALAATLKKGEFAPTINLNVQFFHPAKVGKIKGTGQIEKKGRKICYLSGKLIQDNKVIASSTASAIISKF